MHSSRNLVVALLVTLSLGSVTAASAQRSMPEETVFSNALRFKGEVIEVLPSGKAIREIAIIRGREFEWTGKVEGRVAAPERLGSKTDLAPDIDDLSIEELAENLRGVALFNGHQFVEAEPAYDLAQTVKMYRELEREGFSPERLEVLLPAVSPSQGNAEHVLKPHKAETPPLLGSDAQKEVLGSKDDRVVYSNTSYPGRVHIVFDNTGSTSTINGSQGSGSLIGPSTAMSVAHVFWHEDNNTWEADHKWAPGFDSADSDSSPWGDWYRCYLVTIPGGYVTYESSTYDYAVVDFDVGCNSVDNGVNSDRPGATVGWLGVYVAATSTIESKTGYVRGYPGASQQCGDPARSCAVRVWGDKSSASENDARTREIRHKADTSGGQSGSAFYHYADPSCSGCGYGPYLVGMHRWGGTSYNKARRYDSTVNTFMKAYSSDY